MAPKAGEKAKEKQKEKVRDQSKTKVAESKPTTPKSSPAKSPAKRKENAPFTDLEGSANDPLPINVKFEGIGTKANPKKEGTYAHTLKLEASSSFSLLKTVMIKDGEYKDQQAIIICPAKAFPFLKLPPAVRNRVYRHYFAGRGTNANNIALDGKRKVSKEIYAKGFADGDKNRAAILAVNREIHAEAVNALFSYSLIFDNTTTLLDFLTQVDATTRLRIETIEIKSFVKTSSRTAMHMLAEAGALKEIKISQGVGSDNDPVKAARIFYSDAYKFFDSMASRDKDKYAGLNMMNFEKSAFKFRGEKKDQHWDQGEIDQFKKELRARIHASKQAVS